VQDDSKDSTDAAVDALKQAFAESALPPLVTPPRAYGPIAGLTHALVVLVAVQLVVDAGNLVALLWSRCSDLQLSPRLMVASILVGAADAMVYLAALVVFCFWVHRAYANLIPLGSRRTRFTPGWAVGHFFIPLLSFVRGLQVMRDLWIESQPLPVERAADATLVRRAPLVGWWWAMWIVMTVSFHHRSSRMTNDDWLTLNTQAITKCAIEIIAGVLFIAVVHGIARRQHEQWDDMVRRQPVPPPTDLLR
jgi:hypothetical protein